MSDDFPADVREFIAKNIESLAQLELLLLLHGEGGRQWSAGEVAQIFGISATMSVALLSELVGRGFARSVDDKFQYDVKNVDTDQLIGKLGQTYQSRRVAVTTEIYSKPMNRLKTFAEAFRFRREE